MNFISRLPIRDLANFNCSSCSVSFNFCLSPSCVAYLLCSAHFFGPTFLRLRCCSINGRDWVETLYLAHSLNLIIRLGLISAFRPKLLGDSLGSLLSFLKLPTEDGDFHLFELLLVKTFEIFCCIVFLVLDMGCEELEDTLCSDNDSWLYCISGLLICVDTFICFGWRRGGTGITP